MSPAFLNLGRDLEPRTSLRREVESDVTIVQGDEVDWLDRLARLGNIRDWISKNIEKPHARQAKIYDPRRRHLIYEIKDQVLIRNRVLSKAAVGFAAKLANKFVGPYTITKIISRLVYEVTSRDGKTRIAYVNDITPYRSLY